MVGAVALTASVTAAPHGIGQHDSSASSGFFQTLNQALQDVSNTQNQAATAQASYAAGVPGASLANALVASDKAEVAWNATVAVRNELVAAYQSIMNMQF